jgi:transposase InsO family protein
VWGYDFSHFTRARRAAVAILDIVSRKWIATVLSAEETSTQVEVAFTHALQSEGLWEDADQRATDVLVAALASGDRDAVDTAIGDGQLPLLLAISDNGTQMRSYPTREFLAGVAIAQQFGRPGTPTDQAWIESLFGHVKAEWPHPEKIRDSGELGRELTRVRGGPPQRPSRRTRKPDRIPSNQQHRGEPVIASPPWSGISTREWFINSDTPQLRACREAHGPSGLAVTPRWVRSEWRVRGSST